MRNPDAPRSKLIEEGDGIFEDLFGELRSEETPGEDDSYGLYLGSGLFMAGSLRGGYRREDSFGLTGDDRREMGEPGIRLEALADLLPGLKVFAQLAGTG